jgi:hypothetical protein
MNAAPKFRRGLLAKSCQPPVAKMAVILTSNAAPKLPLNRRTYSLIWPQFAGGPAGFFVWRTYRASRSDQIAQSRLATVLPRSWRSGHSYRDHALNLV